MVDRVLRVELLLDDETTPELERELVGLFVAHGCTTECRRTRAHRTAIEVGWLVLAAVPLQAFLATLGSEAMKDVYTNVKKLVRRIGKGRSRSPASRHPLVLQDIDSGLRIVLDDDLPVEAVQQLVTTDLSVYRHGPLHYDRHRRQWRSELDEAAG